MYFVFWWFCVYLWNLENVWNTCICTFCDENITLCTQCNFHLHTQPCSTDLLVSITSDNVAISWPYMYVNIKCNYTLFCVVINAEMKYEMHCIRRHCQVRKPRIYFANCKSSSHSMKKNLLTVSHSIHWLKTSPAFLFPQALIGSSFLHSYIQCNILCNIFRLKRCYNCNLFVKQDTGSNISGI